MVKQFYKLNKKMLSSNGNYIEFEKKETKIKIEEKKIGNACINVKLNTL